MSTGIQWTDETWNPIRGCSRVSAGCENCYAEKVAQRFRGPGQPYEGLVNRHGAWNGTIKVVEDKMQVPLRWTKPRRVFVNSMSDLFHENISPSVVGHIFLTMALANRHIFQVLTKRPTIMREFINGWREVDVAPLHAWIRGGGAWPPANVHLGVSVEDQATADERIPRLLDTPAAVRWVSYEPAIGPIERWRGPSNDMGEPRVDWLRGWDGCEPSIPGLDWIVVGGESGPGARPCNLEWISNTVEACKEAGVPVFVKQIGSHPVMETPLIKGLLPVAHSDRKGGDMEDWPAEIRVREYPA